MPDRRSRSRSRSPRRDDTREERKRKKRTGWDVGAEEGATPTIPGLAGTGLAGLGVTALAQQNNLLMQNFQNKAMCRIYVGSLDYYLTELEIKSVFQAFGTIVSVDMPKEGDRSKGFCFVEYASPEAAEMALSTMQNFVLKGRTIKVGRPTAVGTGGQQLQRPAMMMPTVGSVGAAGGLTSMAGTSPGSMVNSAQAGAAAATAILAGRTGAADPSNLAGLLSTSQTAVLTPEQQQMQQQLLQQQQQMANNRVYIGNVPFGFSSEDLKKIFVVFGPILSCQLLPSQENPQQHRGYGFIEYATADAAKLAIETMNGFEVAGKQLKVNFATAMRNSPVVATPLAASLLPSMAGLPGASPLTAGLVPGDRPAAGALGATAVGGLAGLGAPAAASPAAPAPGLSPATSTGTGASAPAINGRSQSGDRDGEEKEEEDLPPAPAPADIRSPVVLLSNMVTPSEVDGELKDEVREECSKFGSIKRVEVHTLKETVRIFVEFSDLSGAREAIPSLHGRWFGGRQIIANTYDQELFHQGEYEA
ncbi:RNA recognition motif-containing protein [Toxoplasma gondii ME49]|uniref:RNA recognition motif-containing protein n=14 Tax=Toxoplasma gondii TaxID=5811 RepID=B9PUI6_TOXGV|nr:RNA recognition motif-containing protein [Toxoplasma gondii ME49]EPR61620.1 RNA recognition motif-containing protein [Toxoplasma gondii GT1]ESS32955.1 RNA recognition motif-containing protein [Toxoplasma gondii VEG]KFG37691.1 RNA recognition motif-containing protein [Toxoplasma gondii GAB2-2007-GAL-DOM2]KFG45921.1 RNA recognition motif-containing protein [Toxoplasma gondii p89]KFG53676.1 RNA recognition motif-containing protein [Toxoplasma gondii FOU]KFH07084.1 RNA recognition motif-contai|eukprot:XP_018637384.1 RNA recognition motif-containing protein [Toxoplasma gondii ME49]